jgi:thiopeptide-type bacteriocin biosynthesis protein
LIETFANPILREALIVSSKDLYEAVVKENLSKESKGTSQIQSSLIKYFIRLSTRPTPFGLFSGVAMGRFDEVCGDESDIIVSSPELHTKRARPDMEWVYGLIKKIESNSNIRYNLRVRFNDFTFANGNRIEKPNKTSMQHDEMAENPRELSTSIRYTDQVKMLEKDSMEFRLFSDIINEVVTNNPNVPASKVEAFFTQLLDNEFLLSELRPPLTNTDMLDYVIQVLKNIENTEETHYYIEKIEAIRNSLNEYNSSVIGNGIDAYNKAMFKLKELHECENYLQVDMKAHFKNNVLDSKLKDELEKLAALLYKVAPVGQKSDEMAHYFELFIEKYGYNTEVPVMELLDVDKGLGSPSHFNINTVARTVQKRQKTEKEQRLEALLARKLLVSLRGGKRSTELTDDDIDYVCGTEIHGEEPVPMSYIQSFELNLLAHTGASDGHFTIIGASDSIGKTFGRFGDMFSENEISLLYKGLNTQKELLSDYVIAEITELPPRGRTSNVSINNSDYDFQIVLSTNPCTEKTTLSIRDLYIGAERTGEQFYIKSKLLGKKIIVTMTSMLNPSIGSSTLRFLREVSSWRKINVLNGFYGLLSTTFEYYPRITYGKIILKPETWVVSKDILFGKDDKKNSKDVFDSVFIDYRQKWNIPRFVHLNEVDNKLLLDLDNPTHRNEMYNVLKKNSVMPITITELTCEFDDYAAIDESGKNYVPEIVVPFVLSNKKSSLDKKSAKIKQTKSLITQSDVSLNCMQVDRNSFFLLPGDENWLYYKLYGCSKRQNELLVTIFDELERMSSESLVNKYFFIRYADPEFHIRLRIQANDEKAPSLFTRMNNWLNIIQNDGLISKTVIDTYQREIERYGGSDLIKQAEEYFCCDSKLVMKLIKMQRYEGLSLSFDYIGMSFIVTVLEAFGLSLDEQQSVLDSISNNSSYRKEFQRNRKMFMCAVNSSDNWFEICSYPGEVGVSDVYSLLSSNFLAIEKYAKAVLEADIQGKLTSHVKDIAFSLIHMFCNRLVGNNAWEHMITTLTRHGLHSLKGYLKHRQNNLDDLMLPERLI